MDLRRLSNAKPLPIDPQMDAYRTRGVRKLGIWIIQGLVFRLLAIATLPASAIAALGGWRTTFYLLFAVSAALILRAVTLVVRSPVHPSRGCPVRRGTSAAVSYGVSADEASSSCCQRDRLRRRRLTSPCRGFFFSCALVLWSAWGA